MPVMTSDQPIVGAYGDIFTAPVGTPIPTDLTALADPTATPPAPWVKLGMVSEDGCSWTPPEEETEDIKIWQSPYPKRTVTTGLSSTLGFALDDWDREAITFALGGGTFEDQGANVVYKPPGPGESEMRALFVYIKDGGINMGIYFAKGRITSRDESVFKPDEPALLSVEFGLLVEEGSDPYNLVFESATFPGSGGGGVGTATGATAGTPGTWTPSGATAPADLAAMTSVVATPTSAWTTGQRTPDLGDASTAYWNGSAWVAGQAAVMSAEGESALAGGGQSGGKR